MWERDVGQPSGLSMTLHFILSKVLETLGGQTGGEVVEGLGGSCFFLKASIHLKSEWIRLLKWESNLCRFACVFYHFS